MDTLILKEQEKCVIGTGKTNNVISKVPFPRFILDEIKKILTKHIFIFDNINNASLLRSQLSKALTDSGIPKYKLFSPRHTYVTWILK